MVCLGCTCSKLWLDLSTEAGRGRLSQGPGTRHSRLREVLPPTCSRLSKTAWREGRAEDAGVWSLAGWVLSAHAHGGPDKPVPCPLPQSPHPRGTGSPSAPGQPRCAAGLRSLQGQGQAWRSACLGRPPLPPQPLPEGAQNRFLFGLQPQLAGGGPGGQQGRGRLAALACALRTSCKA